MSNQHFYTKIPYNDNKKEKKRKANYKVFTEFGVIAANKPGN